LNEGNKNRIEGTYLGERNYGKISVSGTRKERKLLVEIFDTNGKLVWDYTIEAAKSN